MLSARYSLLVRKMIILGNTLYCSECNCEIGVGHEAILFGCDDWFCSEECLHNHVDDIAEYYIVRSQNELECV